VRELQALVAPKPPQEVSLRGHAGLVINQLSPVNTLCERGGNKLKDLKDFYLQMAHGV